MAFWTTNPSPVLPGLSLTTSPGVAWWCLTGKCWKHFQATLRAELSGGCQMEPASSNYYYYLLIIHLTNVQSNLTLLKGTLWVENRRPCLEDSVYSPGADTSFWREKFFLSQCRKRWTPGHLKSASSAPPLSTLTLQALLSLVIWCRDGLLSLPCSFLKSCPTWHKGPSLAFLSGFLGALQGAGRISPWIWNLVLQLKGGGKSWSCRSALCIFMIMSKEGVKISSINKQWQIEWLRGDTKRKDLF